jgi:hypothetical protein
VPKLEYFVVCESISVDQETNRVSLFNVVEDIRPVARGEPAHILTQMVAISAWNRESGDEGQDFQLIVRIHAPGDAPQDFPLNFRMERSRQRLYLRIQGVPARHPGELKFELLLNSQPKASHSVTVHPAAAPHATPES